MSLPEVILLIESAERKAKRKQDEHEALTKEQIIVAHNQAMQTVEGVAALFDKHYEMRGLSDYYPLLFGDEGKSGYVDGEKVVDAAAYSIMFQMYAYQRNASRQKAGKRDGEK